MRKLATGTGRHLLLAAGAALALSAPLFAASAQDGMSEADALQAMAARESGRPAYSPGNGVRFNASDNVFVKSAIEVNFTYRAAFVTLPLFRGLSPQNEPVYYIITDASDFDVARKMGINYAPKMRHAVGDGAQRVTIEGGAMRFRGNVDFTPEHLVIPGSATAPFPARVAKPGAVGDAEWSSMAVLPSGIVLNVQMVHNASGTHDRVKSIDLEKRTGSLSLLDGFQGGQQYYYHLVTDVSEELPAALENGVHTPRLAKVQGYGMSRPTDPSPLLGFSPVVNGHQHENAHGSGLCGFDRQRRDRPDQHLSNRPRQRQPLTVKQLQPALGRARKHVDGRSRQGRQEAPDHLLHRPDDLGAGRLGY